MRKILWLLSAAILLTGCFKDDINDLKKDVKELKERMAQYENLLDALNKHLHVAAYEQKDGKHVITMSDGTKLTVGVGSAFVEIGENGNWWIDGVDSGESAKGTPGATPSIVIGGNGNWWINGEDMGIPAKGQSGKDAPEITSIALVDGVMTFTFSNGRTVSIVAAAPEVSITEPVGGFTVGTMQWLRITPEVIFGNDATYSWELNDVVIAQTRDLFYAFTAGGTYTLKFTAKNGVGESSQSVDLVISECEYDNKITRVFEYCPAPGQFINELPEATAEDTPETMRAKAEAALTSGSMVTLGGYGGYVVFGFDHTIVNRVGNDFVVLGNAYENWAEPGIVMVSMDLNNNGLPDDPWYEIAGSEYHKPTTIRNYEITYHKPTSEPADPDEPNYIRWTDNRGGSGYLPKNSYHTQTYYPMWQGETLTLKGTFLRSNVYDQSGEGTYRLNPAYAWGYADNWSNMEEKAQIDISWAVDDAGNAVQLPGIDFIKVYTANCAQAGWLGEVSTEVSGFKDLNL